MRLLSAIILVISFAQAMAKDNGRDPLVIDDFGYASTVELSSEHAVYQCRIPQSIYRNSVNPNLGDLRVFNGAGETVVHAIRRIPADTKTEIRTKEVPIFPVFAKTGQQLSDLSLRVVRNRNSSIIEIDSAGGGRDPNVKIVAYIVNLEDIDQDVEKLILGWTDSKVTFTSIISVDGSDDLQSWRRISRDTVVARLKHNGHMLEKNEVKFSSTKSKYLRLSWNQDDAMPLAKVVARSTSRTSVPDRDWNSYVTVSDDKSSAFLFETEGGFPVDRAQVVLPEVNTVAWAYFDSKSDAKSKSWRSRGKGLVYDLMVDGKRVSRLEITLRQTRDRIWRVRIPEAATVLGNRQPQVKLGWRPDQLLFVARGQPPFTVAYGNYNVGANELPVGKLLSKFSPFGHKPFVPASATLDSERSVRGQQALIRGWQQQPWKRWLLWAALIAGVAVLGWMALSLSRQLAQGDK